jgi:putative inorganic carbon (HCO3(-)) transporter
MTRRRAAPLTAIALALIAAGAAYFTFRLGFVRHDAVSITLAAVGAAVLVYLVLAVDPAWILSAGLVTTMFSGHWGELGLSTTASPHRILLVVGLLAVIARAPGARDRPPIEFRGVHFVLAAALGYALVSAFVAGTLSRSNAHFVLLDEFGLLPFLMFLVAPVAFATERQRRILLGSLVAVGGYLAVTAILERLKITELVFPRYINDPHVGTHFGRARGPFVEAGADGLALFACSVAAAVALTLWRRPWQRVCAAIVVVLAPVGLLLTVTRSVWLAAVVGTFVAVVTTPGLRRLAVPIAAFGVGAVLVAFALIPGVRDQVRERQSNKGSVQERQNTTAAGLRMIADRPLIGFGWDRGNDRIEPYFRLDPNIPLKGQAAGFHNVYLQYGVGLGVIGLGLWLLGIAMAIGGALGRDAPPTVRPWQVGLKAFIGAWAIVGLSTPGSYSFSTFLLWTWAGVAMGAARPRAHLVPTPYRNGGPPGGNGGPPRGDDGSPDGNGHVPADRREPALV